MFRTVYARNPAFDPKDLDVITDRNNLRKLLKVVCRESFDTYRIDVELVGNTLLLTRWERDTEEQIREFRGFGHEFEKTFTAHDNRGPGRKPTGHHRVVQYNFGGLNMLVRFETDAYHRNLGVPSTSSTNIDGLTSAFKSIKLEPDAEPRTLKTDNISLPSKSISNLRVIQDGIDVPHGSLIEIKTRSKHKRIVMKDVVPQLFFAQIPYLIVGYHVRGLFQSVETKNVKEDGDLDAFEREYTNELKKVVKFLRVVRKEIAKLKDKRGSVLSERGSFLLYERVSPVTRSLPEDLLEKWS